MKFFVKYFAYRPSFAPAIAKVGLTSSTSGARGSPLSERTAWFSAADDASGSALVIGIPYLRVNVLMISP